MTVKMQVPIDEAVRDGLERRAKSLGFDSAQAYIRVWAKAEVEGRSLDFGAKTITLSPEADKRYADAVAELDLEKQKNSVTTYNTVDKFMKDLR